MLEISGLTKRYKNSDFYSVKNVSFTVNDGEIFGFLGKNGAGKSTTIKCLTGIIPFEEGSIKVCGFDIQKEPIKAKLNIGYVPDNHAVYENLTGREYVNYMGNIYRVPKNVIEERIENFCKLFNLSHAIDKQIRSYSHGMKQKICIIAALVHMPKFWVLDEPLMGLDPQSTFEIKEYMKMHKKLGNSVFFSSHNIDMVEKLCDRVAIMNHGQLMEIIDVKKFMAESDVPLETYFLNLTREEKAEVIKVDDKKTRKAKEKADKKARKESKKLQKQEKKSGKEDSKNKIPANEIVEDENLTEETFINEESNIEEMPQENQVVNIPENEIQKEIATSEPLEENNSIIEENIDDSLNNTEISDSEDEFLNENISQTEEVTEQETLQQVDDIELEEKNDSEGDIESEGDNETEKYNETEKGFEEIEVSESEERDEVNVVDNSEATVKNAVNDEFEENLSQQEFAEFEQSEVYPSYEEVTASEEDDLFGANKEENQETPLDAKQNLLAQMKRRAGR